MGADRMDYENIDARNLAEHVDVLINRMDIFGIRRAVLTPSSPQMTNLCLEGAAIYPDRLFSSCQVMPRPIEKARMQFKEFVDDGCRALILDEEFCYPEDPATLSLVAEAAKANIPVMFHNEVMQGDWLSLADKASVLHPNGKFVILHMGGLFGFPQMIPLISRENIWLEISVNLAKLVESPLRVFLDAVVQDIGVRKLVFGSEHHSEYPDIMASLNLIDLNVETS
ncbi:MAG: hypothetical protein EAX95_15515, partial [Candidatus Thorarchaeota archaeon]|nr:hypothetical protein [Candidatus Thorarchaeota archaeon]